MISYFWGCVTDFPAFFFFSWCSEVPGYRFQWSWMCWVLIGIHQILDPSHRLSTSWRAVWGSWVLTAWLWRALSGRSDTSCTYKWCCPSKSQGSIHWVGSQSPAMLKHWGIPTPCRPHCLWTFQSSNHGWWTLKYGTLYQRPPMPKKQCIGSFTACVDVITIF